ncbi:MAG: murein biosynthesis integral membrane protein MurJ [Patulibacter sp.]|nr:murein biosynthesis integral membrane protein MurJ [Patulibacter sp.]
MTPSSRRDRTAGSRERPRAARGTAGDAPGDDDGLPPLVSEEQAAAGRARNTIIFSIATGLSRIAGLVREMVSAFVYGGGALASAFTLAFQVPNLLRSLFADMALSAAFVPVFSELLEQRRRREALLLLSTLFWVLLIGLGLLTAVAMVAAPLYVPLFTSAELTAEIQNVDHVTAVLSQIMLPTVLLLGLNGVLVGALNAYDHFSIPAISPLVWNVVIIAVTLGLLPFFDGNDKIYAQAIGVLVGTLVQLLMIVPVLRRFGIRLVPKINFSDPRLKQVLVLMVPVALSLGLINFSAAINAKLGAEVSPEGPRAIEVAFRLYMLPQGVFSVAIVTVLFPVLSRAVARGDRPALRGLVSSGMAQILVMLVPVGLLFASPVIANDIIRVLFQYGEWSQSDTDAAAEALVWLGLCLALNGVSLLLSRTFFAMQRPWANTGLALASLVVSAIVSIALYGPFGIAGIIIGTLFGNSALVGAQIWLLRRETGGPLGLLPVVRSLLQVVVASVFAVLVATGVVLLGRVGSDALGDGTAATIVTILYLGLAIVAGGIVYVGLALDLGLRELEQAGGRFVRLGARLRGIAARVPGAHTAQRFAARPAVTRVLRVGGALLALLGRPLGSLTWISRLLATGLSRLVPAGAPVAVTPSPDGATPTVGPRGQGRDRRTPGSRPGVEPESRRTGRRPATEAGAPPRDAGPFPADVAPLPPDAAPSAHDPAAELYDGAAEWPTIGQRPGPDDVSWLDPAAPPSRSDPRMPDPEAVASEDALRMIAEREAALARIAERQRRRAERPSGRRRKR